MDWLKYSFMILYTGTIGDVANRYNWKLDKRDSLKFFVILIQCPVLVALNVFCFILMFSKDLSNVGVPRWVFIITFLITASYHVYLFRLMLKKIKEQSRDKKGLAPKKKIKKKKKC